MKALITGGAGFIGSHLADLLIDRDHEVIALDNLSTGRLSNIEHLIEHPRFDFILGSIVDPEIVDRVVARADMIFHLAAAVGVELIIENPLESLATNIRGSEIVLEAAHKHNVPVLVASSSEIYGKNTSDRLQEEDDRILGSPLKSRWSYSEAKAIDEILAYTYWKEKELGTVIVRLFNTVGPRQTGRYGMVIPRFVAHAVRNEPLTVYGDGTQTRCFGYVGDIVVGMANLMSEPDAYGRVFNLGGTEEISMTSLAEKVIDLANSESKIRYLTYDEAYEEGFEDMQRRVPDITRARNLVGFEPRVGLDEIITRMIAAERS